ncbi:hypothetical protein GLOIN_2v1773984 [Rhizophagus clarus]|uniref:Uncharacterized protein n=1 Tax=Rhizophagus clarus TaxID=94130 RepID=A0A8H3LGR4_9GLOM|nr:hypothetical protein GLOIN_2v1773984 [Rhizophagus clarus]
MDLRNQEINDDGARIKILDTSSNTISNFEAFSSMDTSFQSYVSQHIRGRRNRRKLRRRTYALNPLLQLRLSVQVTSHQLTDQIFNGTPTFC